MSAVTRMYTSVRGLSTAIKDMARMREIVGILVRHGFGALACKRHLPIVIRREALRNSIHGDPRTNHAFTDLQDLHAQGRQQVE